MSSASLLLASLTLGSIGRKILARLIRLAVNLVALLPLLAASLALSAFIVFALIPRRAVYLLLFVLAIPASVYLINPIMSIYSNHGLAHLGFAYATQRLNWPPEDPYFAGAPLHYPWVYDAIVGGASSLLHVAPSWVYAGCNLVALAVTVVAVSGITKLLEGDLITANFAVVLAVLALTVLGAGADMVLEPLTPAFAAAIWGPEALPAIDKFANVNAMPLGMAVGLVFLYKICSIIKATRYNILDIMSVGILIILVGHIYPHIWLTTFVITVVCAAVALRSGERGKAFALLAALVFGNLAVAPYLRVLTGGRAHGENTMLSPDARVYAYRLLHVAVILLPLWLLIAVRRQSLLEQLRRSRVHWAVLGSGLALLLTFLVLNVPGGGYKFRAMAVFCLAPLAAPGLKRIYDWDKRALVVILALQLLPFCFDWYSKSPWGWGSAAEPCYWQGTVLRHGVREEDDLYEWIREHTPAEAILIDNKPYVPIYAQRSVLVARQRPDWKAEEWRSRRDGWLFHPDVWLERIDGHPAKEIRHRNELVDALYREADAPYGEDLVRHLDELTGDRAAFVIARNGREKAALESRQFLRRVAESGDWAVYALLKGKAKA